MFEMTYVLAFSMAVVNIVKKHIHADVVPFATVGLAVVFNLANAYFFGGEFAVAFKDAVISSGIAVGMFVAGDEIRNTNATPFRTIRK